MKFTSHNNDNDNKTMKYFPQLDNSAVLDPDMSNRVARYAEKRLAKAAVVTRLAAPSAQTRTELIHIRHADIVLGECLGQGSFSSGFAVKSINCDDKKKKFDETKLVVKVFRSKLF